MNDIKNILDILEFDRFRHWQFSQQESAGIAMLIIAMLVTLLVGK